DLTLLTNSLLAMELAGTNNGLYDQINVSGALAFDGTLTLSLLDGFTVSAGNRFDIFDFSSSSGAFSLTNLPDLAALMYWDTSALYSSGEIEADWMTGSLQVTLAPAAAVSAGAQWQVDGGAWQNSGDMVSDLVIGDHTLAFKTVAGWATPTNQVVQVDFGETTVTSGTYEELMPVLLAAASRKTHSAAGAINQTLNLNPAVNPTVEPRKNGPTQLLFTFNKEMMAVDGTLDVSEFTLTNATYVSASILSSNLTLNLTNAVDQSKVTVVLNGLGDLTGNALLGTNAVRIRSLYGDVNQSGTVNIADMQVIKFKLASAVSATNFLYDINLSGVINIADMQVAKTMLSHTVPLNSVDTGANSLVTLLSTALSATVDTAVSSVTLGEALGAPELLWNTDGDAVWTTTMALDGSLMAWSGSIGHLNVSWVETTVTGPGTLSFQWKVSSEADADYLTFSIDGVDQPGRLSGEVDWQTLTFSIPSGTHRLTWTYAKNRANAAGLDAGWLRRVSYQRNP
ncbi:MAG: dockerin type I domain-containing protein, partial [Verrucomicrobiia bacterium]